MTVSSEFDYLRDLSVGTVEFVSASAIKVLLEIHTPHSTAFNAGFPVSFPKINGFVLVPNEAGAIVGMISWIGIENSMYPKRSGFKDFDLIDLPFPQRKMSVSLLGTLKKKREGSFEFERGIYQFPSVGDVVTIPTQQQMESIVENREKNAFVEIGTAPIAGNVPVKINPDTLFGRHVAVLGNTGSGKSCSVAGLLRWSIQAAKENRQTAQTAEIPLNARFIVFDTNGEYSRTFDGAAKVKKYRVKMNGASELEGQQLKVPAWMWNSYEWSSVAQASGKMQRPILKQALRSLKTPLDTNIDFSLFFKMIGQYYEAFYNDFTIGISRFTGYAPRNNVGDRMRTFQRELINFKERGFLSADLDDKLQEVHDFIKSVSDAKYIPSKGFSDFETTDIENVVKCIKIFLDKLDQELDVKNINEETPVHFSIVDLPTKVANIAALQNATQFLDSLIMRIQTMLSDSKMSSIINSSEELSLAEWLENHIGSNQGENGEITVIDLSLVPSELIHLVVAVMSRIIFESLQRYRRKYEKSLPTVMVLEEAHNYISRYKQDAEALSPAMMCTQTFEKIAREGRKFGLGLLLSSQRPSELSSTVLSQCNTFLLHRIVNDRDQELVRRLVPDNLGALLDDLPVLPTGKALLIGAASSIPVLVEMKKLQEQERPQSADPDFWDVWTGEEEREIDWLSLAREWQEE